MDVDPATLTVQSFLLEKPPGMPIPGTVSLGDQPSVLVFTPDETLDVLTEFRITLSTDLASVDGQQLNEPTSWRFTTLPPEWGKSELLEEMGDGESRRSKVAVDPMSNAFAVWEVNDGDRISVWGNRYTRTGLWGTPQALDTTDDVDATNPQIAVDTDGNAFAIWEQDQAGPNPSIWGARFDESNGWSAPELLNTETLTEARNPSIGADASGNAVAVWIQRDVDSIGGVFANRYVSGEGWGDTAVAIEPTGISLIGTNTSVAVARNGSAVAAWRRPRVDNDNVWGNSFAPNGGWGTAQLIKEVNNDDATDPRVAIDNDGTGYAVWQQTTAGRDSVWSNRFDAGTWGDPELIESFDEGNAVTPDITADALGNAYAVWSQDDGDFANIWANTYDPNDGGWGTAELIETPAAVADDDDDAIRPRISANPSGIVFAVWLQGIEGWLSVRSNRYTTESGWGVADFIEDKELRASEPSIAVDEANHAHAVWPHAVGREDGNIMNSDRIRTNRFE